MTSISAGVSTSVSAGMNAATANVVGNSQVNTAANAAANTPANTPDIVANEAATPVTQAATQAAPLPNVGASTNVAISAGAQQKLADEQVAAKVDGTLPKADGSSLKADGSSPKAEAEEEGDFESFVFGALGLDHPEEIDENGDPSYSAGQYVKAAATVGGMIAMFI